MKVTYGISGVHYARIKANGSYDTPKAMPGGVSLSVSPVSADMTIKSRVGNVPYKAQEGEVSGSLVIASVPLAFLTDIFGITVDGNGAVIEKGYSKPVHFALLYQTEGDSGDAKRVVWYDCTAQKPNYSIRTNEEGISVTTDTLTLTMRRNPGRLMRGYNDPLKAELTDSDTGYDTFYSNVYGA